MPSSNRAVTMEIKRKNKIKAVKQHKLKGHRLDKCAYQERMGVET